MPFWTRAIRCQPVSWWFWFVLVYIESFYLSGVDFPSIGQDHSFQAALEYAVKEGMQFGVDIVFTYGPLNYLLLPTSQGYLLAQRMIFALSWSGVVAYSITMLMRKMPNVSRSIFFTWFLFFSLAGESGHHVILVIGFACILLTREFSENKGLSFAYLATISLLSLIKFNFFLLVSFGLTFSLLALIIQRKFRPAACIAAAFVGFFLLFWVASGQHLASLGPWVRSSAEIAVGYGAMALQPEPQLLFYCIVSTLVLVTAYIFVFWSIKSDISSIPLLITFAVIVFVCWKHGVVRAGGAHTFNLLFMLPLLFGLLLAIADRPLLPGTALTLKILNVGLLISCLLGVNYISADILTERLMNWPERMALNAQQIYRLISGDVAACYETRTVARHQGRWPDLPKARKMIGDASVDVINFNQWAALANNLNYRPRPVIQGYSVYTPYLQNLNLTYFTSRKRPDYLLFKIETIDQRLESLDDAVLLPFIFKNYEPVGEESDFLILKTNSREPVPVAYRLMYEKTVGFDQVVNLSGWNDTTLVMQVDIKESLCDRLISFIYQPPAVMINISSGKGMMTRRYINSMGRQGFMINPLLSSNDDLTRMGKGEWNRTTKVSFSQFPEGKQSGRNEIVVRLFSVN